MSFTSTLQEGVVIAIIFVGIISVIVYKIDVSTKKSFEYEIKTLAARNYMKSDFEDRSNPLYSDVEAIAKEYFDFCKGTNENNTEFIERFAMFLEYPIPQNADFSKFR